MFYMIAFFTGFLGMNLTYRRIIKEIKVLNIERVKKCLKRIGLDCKEQRD